MPHSFGPCPVLPTVTPRPKSESRAARKTGRKRTLFPTWVYPSALELYHGPGKWAQGVYYSSHKATRDGALAYWLRRPVLLPPLPAPAGMTPGASARPVCSRSRLWAAALLGSGFMAAQPLSRMLRRLLRSSARSCSSGAPVTQPRLGESARAASEVSPPRPCPQLPGAGVDRARCPFPPVAPGLSACRF